MVVFRVSCTILKRWPLPTTPSAVMAAWDVLRPEAELKIHAIRQEKGYGDCIDCGFCVQVCPAGIDIRDGLQYRCISCGLCIDACNNIMDSVGYPRGLIRYDSEANLALPLPAKPHIRLEATQGCRLSCCAHRS